jgi:hypothetical protein
MWAFAMLKKGLPRMSDTFEFGCISNTTKVNWYEESSDIDRNILSNSYWIAERLIG